MKKYMKATKTFGASLVAGVLTFITALTLALVPNAALASGGTSSGGGGGGISADTIKVSKCYYDAPTGEGLIKASSSDTSAHLYAYRLDGTYLGEVQNGGGSRYGGTVMPYEATDPVYLVIISSSGGSITVPTTPFQI
jgi:hypothetical protein